MPSRVQIDLVAQDNASPTLDKVRQQLEMFPTFARNVDAVGPPVDRASRSFNGLDISASKATRAVRGLAVPLISELSPALGGTASAMGHVVSSALLLGSGMGALVIGATVLAGIVGGKLLTAWQQNRVELENWHRALQSSDPGFFSERMKTLTTDLLNAGKAFEDAKRRLATAPPDAAPGALPGVGGFGNFPGTGAGPGDVPRLFGLGARAAAEAEVERLRAEWLEKNEKFLQARKEFDLRVSDALEREGLAGSEGLLRQTERDRATLLRANALAQRGLYDYRLSPGEADYQKALRAADELERGQGKGGDPAAAAVARDVARRQRDIARGFALSAGELDLSTIPGISGMEPDVALQRAREARGLELGAGEPDLSSIPRIYGTEQDQKLAENRLRLRREETDILRETAMLQLEAVGLSRDQTRAIEEGAIARQHALELELAGDDQAKQRLADLRATTGLRRIAERDEPLPGLRRGLADIEADWGATGLRMQAVAQNTAGGMARAFDDGLFSTITGKFEELPGIAQRFGADMVRAFTGELSKMVTSAVFGQFRAGLDSLFPGGASGTSFFGAGSGGGPRGYDAGGGSGGGPMLTSSGRPLAQSEIATAYAAGGDAGVRALREGRATVVGGEFIADTDISPEFSQSAYALNPATPMGSGFSWRQGVGIAGSAALLGLTAYGATQAQNTSDVVTSAAGGALAGAALGGQLGGLAGYGGTGAAAGAVLGAAIAGTIALLAKQEADKQTKKERQAAEVARAVGAGGDLVSSASQAQSLPDLFRRITAFGSGYTGGTSPVAMNTTVQTPTGPRFVGIENPTYPVATLQDLLAAPESLQANIQAGVNPDLLAGPNAATSTALQAIARDLVDQFREAEMGVGLTQEDQVGGLTRRTTFPASRADMLTPGLDVEIDELALNELSEDDRALLMLETMSRVAVETDFVSTISDGATGQIVSITRMARSTIALPGIPGTGATTPPPGVPPAAIPAIGAATGLNIPRFTEPLPLAPHNNPIYGDVAYPSSNESDGPVIRSEVVGYAPVTAEQTAAYAEQTAAYAARRSAFYAPYLEALTDAQKTELAALSADAVGQLVQAGYLTTEQVGALLGAGLLPRASADIAAAEAAALTFGAAGPPPTGGEGAPGSISHPSLSGAGLGALGSFGVTFGTQGHGFSLAPSGLLGSLISFAVPGVVGRALGTVADTALGLFSTPFGLLNSALGIGANLARGAIANSGLPGYVTSAPVPMTFGLVNLSYTTPEYAGLTVGTSLPTAAAPPDAPFIGYFADPTAPTGYVAGYGFPAGAPVPTGYQGLQGVFYGTGEEGQTGAVVGGPGGTGTGGVPGGGPGAVGVVGDSTGVPGGGGPGGGGDK